MWEKQTPFPIWEYLLWLCLISGIADGAVLLLEQYSVSFEKTGELSLGYLIYALVGILLSTPAPMIAAYILLYRHERLSLGDFLKRIIRTDNPRTAVLIVSFFCTLALLFALINGTRTTAAWFLIIPAFPLMILGGGVEEIGWRGLLLPAMEQRILSLLEKYRLPSCLRILSVFPVAAVWGAWHGILWLLPSSQHYGDSLTGFFLNIFAWSFALSAIYKTSHCAFACALYHAFVNAIGVIYDWNSLFDAYPGNQITTIYRILLVLVSAAVWLYADRKPASQKRETGSPIRKELAPENGH